MTAERYRGGTEKFKCQDCGKTFKHIVLCKVTLGPRFCDECKYVRSLEVVRRRARRLRGCKV